jgi:hypothetical protein
LSEDSPAVLALRHPALTAVVLNLVIQPPNETHSARPFPKVQRNNQTQGSNRPFNPTLMKNSQIPLILCLTSLGLSLATVPALTAANEPSAFEKFVQEAKHPVSWLTWGADFRARDEYYNNIVSLSSDAPRNEQNVVRLRGRVWTAITPVTNLTLNARLASEVREWTKPAFTGSFAGQQGMEWRYGIVDNLNVKFNNIADQPLALTVGRQDIAIGDYWNWWLVADGTPNDGSWTYFLDSARLNFEAKEIKTKFDVTYVYQSALPDEWLPTLDQPHNGRDILPYLPPGGYYNYYLTEQNEQGVIAYVSNKSLKNTTVEGFFIYKRDDKEIANGDDANIYTVGGRVHGTLADHWQYSAEGAYQFGEKRDTLRVPTTSTAWRDIDAFGANARLTYLFKDKLNNQLQLQYEYLSGDDSGTGNDEMFDILWGRWPRWSELYIYSYAAETSGRFAQLNNVQRFGPMWSFNPRKGMTFSAMYNALFAPQEVPTRALSGALFSQDGNFRGHYLQTVLKHQFSKHVSAHLWAEFIWQGDYYTSRDLLTFIRPEIMFTF